MSNNCDKNEPKGLKKFYSSHPIICHILFICVTAVVLGWLALFFLDVWTMHGKTTKVPEIKNKTLDAATGILADLDLKIEISDSIYDETLKPGTIVESWPKAGAVVKPGREVYVTIVSFSPKQITVTLPLTDVSSKQAVSYLESLGIKSIKIINVPSQFDDSVESAKYNGKAITVGTRIPVNATVVLEVGKRPDTTSTTTWDDEDTSSLNELVNMMSVEDLTSLIHAANNTANSDDEDDEDDDI